MSVTESIGPDETPIYTQLRKEYAAEAELNRIFGPYGYSLPEERPLHGND